MNTAFHGNCIPFEGTLVAIFSVKGVQNCFNNESNLNNPLLKNRAHEFNSILSLNLSVLSV